VDKISSDEKRVEQLLDELDEVRRRLLRNRKVREVNNQRAKEKYDCLLREMEASGELAQLEDVAAMDHGFEMVGVTSPFDWNAVHPSFDQPLGDLRSGPSRSS